jgi:hypothetical protein
VKDKAVKLLQRNIRRHVILNRFKNMTTAVASWKLTHGKELLVVCYREVARQKKLALQV